MANSTVGVWRSMRRADLSEVDRLADKIHASFPEDPAVFAERLDLYPSGCFILEGADGAVQGYAVTHPWHFKMPPALNVMLSALPAHPTTYYIHDVALDPIVRGGGAASRVVQQIIQHAQDTSAANMSLIAVNASTGFWARHGFEIFPADAALDTKLKSYEESARFMVRPLKS